MEVDHLTFEGVMGDLVWVTIFFPPNHWGYNIIFPTYTDVRLYFTALYAMRFIYIYFFFIAGYFISPDIFLQHTVFFPRNQSARYISFWNHPYLSSQKSNGRPLKLTLRTNSEVFKNTETMSRMKKRKKKENWVKAGRI